jgi:hypothetical protein
MFKVKFTETVFYKRTWQLPGSLCCIVSVSGNGRENVRKPNKDFWVASCQKWSWICRWCIGKSWDSPWWTFGEPSVNVRWTLRWFNRRRMSIARYLFGDPSWPNEERLLAFLPLAFFCTRNWEVLQEFVAMWLSFAFLSDRIGSRWFDISLLQKLSGKSVWKTLCASVQFGCQAVWFSVILHRWCWVPSCFHSTEQVLMQFIPVPSLAFWTTSGSLPASCCPHVTSFLLLSQRLGLSFARNLKSGVLQCPRTALSHKLWNFGPGREWKDLKNHQNCWKITVIWQIWQWFEMIRNMIPYIFHMIRCQKWFGNKTCGGELVMFEQPNRVPKLEKAGCQGHLRHRLQKPRTKVLRCAAGSGGTPQLQSLLQL